jgi:hypothetical protein
MKLKCFECSSESEHESQAKHPKCAHCGHAYGPPKPGSSTICYAHKSKREVNHWEHVSLHPKVTYFHDFNETNPIFCIRVTLDEETGTYWAWWDYQNQHFTMVYPHLLLVRVCFAYGPEAEEKRGRGKVCRVRIEEENNANNGA